MVRDLIFDIGMHNGRDTEFYLNKGFKVVAIEASPKAVEDATLKFSSYIKSGQLIIINKAISDSILPVQFKRYIGHDDWSSVVDNWNQSMYTEEYEAYEIQTTNVDELIAEVGVPYYMKIDIEGSDVLCLNALLKLSEKPQFISVELLTLKNLENSERPDYLEILCKLRALGYTKFQLVDQSKHSETKCPKPALEGEYFDMEFDGYSSGLFGKELPNNWKSIDEIALDYLLYSGQTPTVTVENLFKGKRGFLGKHFYSPKITVESQMKQGSWYDIHATY